MKSIKPIVLFLFLGLLSGMNAQGKFYVNSYLQFERGRANNKTDYSNLFFYWGLKYQTQDFSLSLNIPIVFVNYNYSKTIVRSPDGVTVNSAGNLKNNSVYSQQQSDEFKGFGIGDLYINGSFQLIPEKSFSPAISIDGYIKIPLATKTLGIGSGAVDYLMAVGAKKYFRRILVFAQMGYLTLGKISEINLQNPFTLSLGLGYIFNSNKHSVFLGYNSYSTIIRGVVPPEQISIGYNYLINSRLFLTTIITFGINTSESNYFLSGGLNYEL